MSVDGAKMGQGGSRGGGGTSKDLADAIIYKYFYNENLKSQSIPNVYR